MTFDRKAYIKERHKSNPEYIKEYIANKRGSKSSYSKTKTQETNRKEYMKEYMKQRRVKKLADKRNNIRKLSNNI